MSATIKIIFIKSPTPVFNLAYFDGDIIEVYPNQAEVLIEAGVAREYIPEFRDIEDLPVDIPGRDKLLQAGVKSMEELKLYDDLTEISGIGKKTAEAIIDYLKK
jgi:hypothetical protein